MTLASVRPIAEGRRALCAGKRAAHVGRGAGARPQRGYRLLPAAEAGPGGIDRSARRKPARASAWCRCAMSRRRPFSSCSMRSASRPHAASRQRPQHADHHRQRLRPRRRDRHHPELRCRLDARTVGRHLPGAQLHAGAADRRDREDHGFRRRRPQPERRSSSSRSAGSIRSSWSARSRNISSARGTWIARLDKSDTEGVNLKSYPLRYGNSKLVVALLNEMLLGRRSARGATLDSASSQISPGAGISVSSSGAVRLPR